MLCCCACYMHASALSYLHCLAYSALYMALRPKSATLIKGTRYSQDSVASLRVTWVSVTSNPFGCTIGYHGVCGIANYDVKLLSKIYIDHLNIICMKRSIEIFIIIFFNSNMYI